MIEHDDSLYTELMSYSDYNIGIGTGNNYLSFTSQDDTISSTDFAFTMTADQTDNESPENVIRESHNGFWKYEEDLTLKEVQDYLSGTYRSHYTSKESKTQTLDLIEAIGDAEPFCRSNAIKYLSRFGKKGGKSQMDILKAIHYCVLLYHFSGLHKNNSSDFPY